VEFFGLCSATYAAIALNMVVRFAAAKPFYELRAE